MKYCPYCLNQYSDLMLSFCLQDGTPLGMMPVKQSNIDTVAFSRPVTVQNILPTSDFRLDQPPRNQTQQYSQPDPAATGRAKKSRKGLIALAIVVPVVMLATAGGGAAWIYFEKQKRASAQETATVAAAEKETTDKPPEQPAVPETLKSQSSETNAKIDVEAIKKEVAGVVESWKDYTEGHNAAKLGAMYGEKVDYLGKPGVSGGEIRAEMQKTFDAFSEIGITISNLTVAVDSEGTSATAVFDKEWTYEARPKLSEGKAHIKLHFQKLGGEWKIVTERQLKVYYNEN